MNEFPPQNPPVPPAEKEVERLPSKEEILSIFGRFLKDRKYKEIKLTNDEHGVSVYAVETDPDEHGKSIEYRFQKAKYDYKAQDIPSTTRYSASIHSTTFEDGMPTGGECVANYLDGTWKFTSGNEPE